MSDTLGVLTPLAVGDRSVVIAALDALGPAFDVGHLPYTLRILLEHVLRADALGLGNADEVRAVAAWEPAAEPTDEISFRPSRVRSG